MIKHSREDILAINPVFSFHLSIVQDDKYNPAHQPVEEGDEIFLEEENITVSLTKEEADQINVEDQAFYQEVRDRVKIKEEPTWAGSLKMMGPNKNPKEYLTTLGAIFKKIGELYPDKKLLLMGDWPTPWLIEKGAEKQAQDAYKFFKGYCKATFNGGFTFSKDVIDQVIPHLFWLTRGSEILPDFLLAFEQGKTIFSICRFGVLHVDSYDTTELLSLESLLKKEGFSEVNECIERLKF